MRVKTIFKLIAGLAVIAIILVGALVTFFDPNDYKQQIIEQVEQETGRRVTINGQLGWDLYPRIAISAESFSLGNPDGFSGAAMLQVEHAAFSVAIIPLLRQQMIIESVVLEGATISLERLANGKDNWSDLQRNSTTKGGATDDLNEGGNDVSALMVKRLSISNSSIKFRDALLNESLAVQITRLSTGALGARRAVPVELDLAIDSSRFGQYDLNGKGSLTVDETLSYINVPDLQLTLTPIQHQQQQLTVTGQIGLDQARKQFVIRDFEITSPNGSSLKGDVTLADYNSQPQVDGQLTINAFTLASYANAFGIDVTGLPDTVTGSLVMQTVGDTINIDPLKLAVAGGSIDGRMAIMSLLNKPTYQGRFKIAPLNPAKLMRELGMDTPRVSSADALRHLDGDISFNGDMDYVQLQPLNLRLDDSSVNGDVRITRFSNPHYAFNLGIDKINIDDYLPPTSTEQQRESSATSEAQAAQTVGGLRLDGTIKIASLQASGLRLSQLNASVISAGGETRLSPLSAALYGGRYNGNIVLKSQGKRLTWSANERLDGVNLGPLLKDLIGQDRIDGHADITLKLNGSGVDQQQMMSSLAGQMSFAVSNGNIKGINLAAALREAKAKLNNKPVAKAQEQRQTDFAELTGTASIKSGMVANNDLVLKSPFLRVTGKGTVNLPASSVDYLLTTKVTSTLKGQGGAEFSDLEGLTIPVRVKGPFDDLSYSLDLEELLKQKAKQALDKEKDKLKDKLLEKLGVPTSEAAPAKQEAQQKPQDVLKDKLKQELFKNLKF